MVGESLPEEFPEYASASMEAGNIQRNVPLPKLAGASLDTGAAATRGGPFSCVIDQAPESLGEQLECDPVGQQPQQEALSVPSLRLAPASLFGGMIGKKPPKNQDISWRCNAVMTVC